MDDTVGPWALASAQGAAPPIHTTNAQLTNLDSATVGLPQRSVLRGIRHRRSDEERVRPSHTELGATCLNRGTLHSLESRAIENSGHGFPLLIGERR